MGYTKIYKLVNVMKSSRRKSSYPLPKSHHIFAFIEQHSVFFGENHRFLILNKAVIIFKKYGERVQKALPPPERVSPVALTNLSVFAIQCHLCIQRGTGEVVSTLTRYQN